MTPIKTSTVMKNMPSKKSYLQQTFLNPIPATLSSGDEVQDITDDVFEEESSPPVVSTNTGELDSKPNFIDEPPINYTLPLTETPPWRNKRPASESQLTDGPIIISPEDPIPSSDSLLD